MKRNTLSKIILFSVLLVAFGCKARKPAAPLVTGTKTEVEEGTKAETLSRITQKQVDYNTAVIKAKADLSIDNNNNDVGMNIRMEKGKAIWVAVTAIANLEVARVLITPDSIKILNKLESTYIKKPFSYVHRFVNTKVDFSMLQNLFIGNAMAGTLASTSTIDVNGGQTQIKGDLAGLAYLLIFNGNNNLIQSNLNDKVASQTLLVNYAEYRKVSNEEVPHVISIKSNVANKNVAINLNYSFVSLNQPVEFPFNVSKRFTVKD